MSTDPIAAKIVDNNGLSKLINIWRLQNQKVVFTNGCFDILHRGHVDYLNKAKQKGTKLIVGLNTDASVKRQGKGEERPINDENSRAYLLASLHCVDAVVLFDEDTPLALIKSVMPQVLVKGSDYKPEDIVGYREVTGNGGTVETLDLVEGFSTTKLIEKIRKQG